MLYEATRSFLAAQTQTMLIKSLFALLALVSYWLALTSRINSFLLFYVLPQGSG